MSEKPNPNKEPSLLAQTFQAIGQVKSAFQLPVTMELNYPMWRAAANLTTQEYAACLRLKREWADGTK